MTKEMKEWGGKVAAFFDLDGTLVKGPSLERRYFHELRRQRALGIKNYFAWWKEGVLLAPQGMDAIRYANKMYLQGVATKLTGLEVGPMGFFPEGIERVVWHIEQGHRIFLVTGTIEPQARKAAEELEKVVFVQRGMAAKIEVCATRLEERQGKWTGRILGEAMHGEAKAHTVQTLAERLGLDLTRSYGYGNSVQDQELLEGVGKPAAVNPTRGLARIAGERNWLVLKWGKSKILRPKACLRRPGPSYKLHSQEAPVIYREKGEWESLG